MKYLGVGVVRFSLEVVRSRGVWMRGETACGGTAAWMGLCLYLGLMLFGVTLWSYLFNLECHRQKLNSLAHHRASLLKDG